MEICELVVKAVHRKKNATVVVEEEKHAGPNSSTSQVNNQRWIDEALGFCCVFTNNELMPGVEEVFVCTANLV